MTDPRLEPSLHVAITEVARACRILEMEDHGDMPFTVESADGLPVRLYG